MKEIDGLIIFDLFGPIAHFRKFYTNSSSLSYSFPPRTTVTGLIAGILGMERDSYYDEFNSSRCSVAISIKNKIRKIMQTVNLLNTDEFSSFRNVFKNMMLRKNLHPTPLELIFPALPEKEVSYRIYFFHSNDSIMRDLN
ncbi:type I-B CRISPR-associated protein Cas5, partial [candidate division KSB1 bacterium]